MFLNILKTFPFKVFGVSFTLNSLLRTLFTKWLVISQSLLYRNRREVPSSHHISIVLPYMSYILFYFSSVWVLSGAFESAQESVVWVICQVCFLQVGPFRLCHSKTFRFLSELTGLFKDEDEVVTSRWEEDKFYFSSSGRFDFFC